jgi:Flp pilus assembly protein TadB
MNSDLDLYYISRRRRERLYALRRLIAVAGIATAILAVVACMCITIVKYGPVAFIILLLIALWVEWSLTEL